MDLPAVVKAFFVPGSMGFLVLGLTAGVILTLAGRRTRRGGMAVLLALALLYWVLALPATASALEAILNGGQQPLTTLEQVHGEVAILVLGGGSETFQANGMRTSSPSEPTALRSLEAARLYGLAGEAQVIASGGAGGEAGDGEPESGVIRRLLEDQGVPAASIREEPVASSTREEALLLTGMLAASDFDQIIVVTSPSHMRRALGALRAAGLNAIGSPSLEHSETAVNRSPLLPNERALRDSRQAVREMLALVYYGARGWLAPVEGRG